MSSTAVTDYTLPTQQTAEPWAGVITRTTYDSCRWVGTVLTDVDPAVKASLADACHHYRPAGYNAVLRQGRTVTPEQAAWVAVALIIGHIESHRP